MIDPKHDVSLSFDALSFEDLCELLDVLSSSQFYPNSIFTAHHSSPAPEPKKTKKVEGPKMGAWDVPFAKRDLDEL